MTTTTVTTAEVLTDAFGRVRDAVHAAVADLSTDDLARPPAPGANTVAWLVWHLTRVQDDHVADAFGGTQVWSDEGWAERLDLPLPRDATGYGARPEDVLAVRAPADLLLGYHDAVHARTVALVAGVGADDLARVVDASWDPPVTLAVRLVSVIEDDLQHAGQAAYVRGLLLRT
ncbi:mycothiol transferase [Actinotalea solisilvae]|uniref:mycothiol transferase n=1 Tax=Actinotalea solisilvae TaxID=2072922 RepID=UPI0018F12CF4|nr:DUF664 domain-containing protein [Actinotalea solisilvae]